MGLLVTNTIENILLDIAIYAVLFNIIYSILFSGIRHPKSVSVILYIIVMEIKFIVSGMELFAALGIRALPQFLISIGVYLILGLTIIIILDRMADYKPRKSFIVISIVIAYLAEFLLAKILFIAINGVIDILIFINWLIMYYFKTWFLVTFNLT